MGLTKEEAYWAMPIWAGNSEYLRWKFPELVEELIRKGEWISLIEPVDDDPGMYEVWDQALKTAQERFGYPSSENATKDRHEGEERPSGSGHHDRLDGDEVDDDDDEESAHIGESVEAVDLDPEC